jgi:hypothetical protein
MRPLLSQLANSSSGLKSFLHSLSRRISQLSKNKTVSDSNSRSICPNRNGGGKDEIDSSIRSQGTVGNEMAYLQRGTILRGLPISIYNKLVILH